MIFIITKNNKNIIVSSDNIKIGQIQNKIELLEYSKKVAWSVIWPECGEGKMEAFWSVHRLRFESWIISDQIVVELSNLHWKKEKTECNKVGKFHLIWRISIFLLHTLLVVFLCVFVGWLLLDLGKVYMLETPAAHGCGAYLLFRPWDGISQYPTIITFYENKSLHIKIAFQGIIPKTVPVFLHH